jgi:hypothetical protein
MQRVQLEQVAKPHPISRAHDHRVVRNGEVLDKDVENPRRHVGFDLQQRHGAVAELFEARSTVSSRSSASS